MFMFLYALRLQHVRGGQSVIYKNQFLLLIVGPGAWLQVLKAQWQAILPTDQLTGPYIFLPNDLGSYECTASYQAISQTESLRLKVKSHWKYYVPRIADLMHLKVWKSNIQKYGISKQIFINYFIFMSQNNVENK